MTIHQSHALSRVNPEDYPNIHKMAILADVAPYSREYNTFRQIVGKEAQGNTELEIEYEKILNRVKKTRESVIRMQDRHFTAPVDEISGTVEEVHTAASSSRNIRAGCSSSPPCPPAPPICRRGPWENIGLFILPHTKTLARARSKPLLDSVALPASVLRSVQVRQDRRVWLHNKTSCARSRPIHR